MTPDYRAWLEEMFATLGRVRIKRFFGLDGIWLNDAMVGLVLEERVYLKTDEASRKAFEEEGASPFTYRMRNGETIVTSYLQLPERLYDDQLEFIEWARRAWEVARASPTARRKRAHRETPVHQPKRKRVRR